MKGGMEGKVIVNVEGQAGAKAIALKINFHEHRSLVEMHETLRKVHRDKIGIDEFEIGIPKKYAVERRSILTCYEMMGGGKSYGECRRARWCEGDYLADQR
jgi:hypothetical protein